MPNFSNYNGYGNSDKKTFTITNGVTGSAIAPVNFDRQCAFIVVRCVDVSNAAATTDTLGIKISTTDTDDLLTLKDDSDAAITILMDSAFHRVIFVGNAKRVQVVLSQAASGGSVTVEVYGIDAAVAR